MSPASCSATCPSRNTGAASPSWLLWMCCYEHGCAPSSRFIYPDFSLSIILYNRLISCVCYLLFPLTSKGRSMRGGTHLSPDASQAEQGLAQNKCSRNRAVKEINNKHLLWARPCARPKEAPANRTFTLQWEVQ